eukprot:10803750-Ditylum_brightwellii.AAC.1
MSLNNESKAVVARCDPSKSHNPEIAYDGCKAGTIYPVSENTNITPDTCSQHRVTIWWLADNCEHIGRNFMVQSEAVQSALDTPKANRDVVMQNGTGLPDPYMNLNTNVIKPEETVRAMAYSLCNEHDWASLGILWTWDIS